MFFVYTGDIVGLYQNKSSADSDMIASGVITNVRYEYVVVAFEENIELNTTGMYRLMLLTNDVTYRRLKKLVSVLLVCFSITNFALFQYLSVLFTECKTVDPL